MSENFEYCNDEIIGLPVGGSFVLRDALSLYGFNRMKVPLYGIQGSPIRPSFTTDNDERTGWYSISNGKWGYSSFGFTVFTLEPGSFTFLDLQGNSVSLNIPETLTGDLSLQLPGESGTIPVVEALPWKNPVVAATTRNITLSGTQVIDTISVVNGDRVLVWAQTDAKQNGIYTVGTPWIRSSDTNTASHLTGATVIVLNGHKNGSKEFTQQTVSPVLGVDDIVWVEISGSGSGFGDLEYYDNNTETDLDIDLLTEVGWITLLDEFGNYCRIKTTTWQFERGDDPYIKGSSPTSAQISVLINTITNKPKIKVGSSSARNISYRFEGIEV